MPQISIDAHWASDTIKERIRLIGGMTMFSKYSLPLAQLVALSLTIAICMYLSPLGSLEITTVAIFVFSLTNAAFYGARTYLKRN
jgi:hypothetical protein